MHVDETDADGVTDEEALDLGQSPAFFVVHLPGDAPSAEDVRARIGELEPEVTDVDLEGAPKAEEFGGLWQFAVLIPGVSMPTLIRLEPAPDMEGAEGVPVSLDGVSWVLVVEAWLDPQDPADAYARIARLLSLLSPDSPAMLDIDSGTWYPPEMRAHLFLELPPEALPTDLLYTLQVLVPESDSDSEPQVGWLVTAGLARCGVPELELFDVPAAHLDHAAVLVSAVAGMLIGNDAPEPGDHLEVSTDRHVAFRLIDEVLDRIDPDAPGGRNTRVDTGESWRLAICSAEESSMLSPPLDLIQALVDEETGIFVSGIVRDRKMVGAHARWPEVVKAFRKYGADRNASVEFLARMTILSDHFWTRVVDATEEGLTVELDPRDEAYVRAQDDHGLSEGSVQHLPVTAMSDWRIVTSAGDIFEAPVIIGLDEAVRRVPA